MGWCIARPVYILALWVRYLDGSVHRRPSVSQDKQSHDRERHEDGLNETGVVDQNVDVFWYQHYHRYQALITYITTDIKPWLHTLPPISSPGYIHYHRYQALVTYIITDIKPWLHTLSPISSPGYTHYHRYQALVTYTVITLLLKSICDHKH